jgi:translation initiation factor 5
MGAQTKYDKKSGTSIVNGAHDAAALSEKLEGFIKKYVQCYACGNPETVVKLKRENIQLKCKACGFVSDVDARLKLNTFIIKNPPDNKLSKAEKKVKKAEKERMAGLEVEAPPLGGEEKKKKKSSKSKSKGKEEGDGAAAAAAEGSADGRDDDDDEDDEEEEEEEEEEDEVVWMTDTSAAAMEARAAEQLSSATAALVTQGNVEAEAEAARKREEKRAAEEAEAAAAVAVAAAEAARLAAAAARLALADPAEALRQAVAAGAGADEVAAKVAKVEGGPAQRMRALYAALFAALPAGERLAPAVAAAAPLLAPHAADPSGQLAQLVAMEALVGVDQPARAKEAPLVLKALYDADLAGEELIVAWYGKAGAGGVLGVPPGAAAAVRAACKPFVEWLQEAESEEEEEEDSDDE